jgi:hypothetical protein
MISMHCNLDFVCTDYAFSLGPTTTAKNLDRYGRAQDFAGASYI